jgi:hypothetical protein
MSVLTSKPLRLAVLAAVVVGVATVGVAYASIPDSNGLIHGCYSPNGSKANGGAQLDIVDSDVATCTKGQQAIAWDQTTSAYDDEGSKVIAGDHSWNTIESISVPAGAYVVSASLRLNATSAPTSTEVTCVVTSDTAAVLDASGQSTTQPGIVVQMPLLGRAITRAQSSLDLECQADPNGVGIDAFMVATRVGVINDGA